MIHISKVSDRFFPEIDFKLKNSGGSAGVISQFVIRVLEVKIDATPDLEFSYQVNNRHLVWRGNSSHGEWEGDGALILLGRNNGWGPARNCELRFSEPVLDQLYSPRERRLSCNIDSLKEATFRLDPRAFDASQFTALHRELRESARIEMEKKLPKYLEWNQHMIGNNSLEENYRQYQKQQRQNFQDRWNRTHHQNVGDSDSKNTQPLSIPLSNPSVDWSCQDFEGRPFTGKSVLKSARTGEGSFFLTKEGFVFDEYIICKCMMESDRTYCVFLDPDSGAQQRTYPISRVIPRSGVDRFHIRIGAKKSCHLRLEFEFTIDGQMVATSKPFDIRIWHPYGSWNHGFEDGDEIVSKYEKLIAEREQRNSKQESEWQHLDLGWKQKQLGSFPFTKPSDSSDAL